MVVKRKRKIKQKNPLKVISGDQVKTLRHTDAVPSAARLGPRALSAGVVDSLGRVLFVSMGEVWAAS